MCVCERVSERERERDRDREIDRETDRNRDRDREREREREESDTVQKNGTIAKGTLCFLFPPRGFRISVQKVRFAPIVREMI